MTTRFYSILAITIALFTSVTSALTAQFIDPEISSSVQSEFTYWDGFTDPYTNYTLAPVGQVTSAFPAGEGNFPDNTNSTVGASRIFQTESPNAFIASSTGIYSFSSPPMGFIVYDQPSFATESVLFQTQSAGALPDLTSASLFYRESFDGELIKVDEPAGNGFLNQSGAYAMWEWDLSDYLVHDYFITFSASSTSLSLQQALLYNYDASVDALGYAFRGTTNSNFAPIGSISHTLVGDGSAKASYRPGDVVELIPTARDFGGIPGNDNYYNSAFVGWTGDLSGNVIPATITFADQQINVEAVFAPLAYGAWVINTFNPYVVNPPRTVRDPLNADPDGDGLTNLMEYALGAPPEAVGGSPEYMPYLEENQNGTSQYVYRRQMAATDLSYLVEVSQDLTNWNHNADSTNQTYTEEVGEAVFNGDGTETVRVIYVGLENPDKVFFRLSVTLTSD